MKIILINPNHNWNTQAEAYGEKSYLRVRKISPPLGLGYLAALVHQEHDVKIIDANVVDMSYDDVVTAVRRDKPDIVAVSSMYPSTEHVIRLAGLLRPHAGVLLVGGADPTVRAERYLTAFDYVNRGQGETSFQKFVAGEAPERIRGLAFMRDGALVDNGVGDMVENLDDLPFIPWDLFPHRDGYRPAVMQIKYSFPSAGMLTSRGCPNHCAYCAIHTVVPQFKERSIANTIEEIRRLVKDYGFTHVEFFDDTFTFRKERVIAFCESLLREGIRIRWSCITRPDTVDRELLQVMKRAGCYFVLYGVQSVDEQVLRTINRPLFREQVRTATRLTKELGLIVRFDFILGLPGATEASMRSSFDFVRETEPDIVDFYPVLWLPGTELTKNFKPVFSDEQLEKIAAGYYKEYYFRPGYLLQVLRHCTRPVYVYRYLICFYALFAGMVSRTLARWRGKNGHA